MLKILLILLTVFGFAEEIEVRLSTATPLKPMYIARFLPKETESNLPLLTALREVLVFDFNVGGFATVLPSRNEWEKEFDQALWKREKVPYVVAITATDNALHATLFDIERSTSKRYSNIPLTGQIAVDRKAMHALADQMQGDVFGSQGIASLRLIYSERKKQKNEWQSDLWIQDADGANRKQATLDHTYCITPSFFPHTAGLKDPPFYFVSYKGGQSKIYAASLNKKPQPLIELRGNQLLPAMNAKATQMAFIGDAAGRADLFLQTFDPQGQAVGKSRQLYSAPRATQASPTFSPDGKRVAFVSDKDGPPRIYWMDLEAKRARPQLITLKNRENISPAWSPDGKKLAFSAKSDGVRQIWIYDFETGEETALTTGPENKENPAWAPDNLHLAFNTDVNEEGQLFLIDLNAKKAVQISQGAGQKRFASWETR